MVEKRLVNGFTDHIILTGFNAKRLHVRSDAAPRPDKGYVLYWMQSAHRFHYNFALEAAVAWANRLQKTLVIYEELHCDYPWACDRFHVFYMEMMEEHLRQADAHPASQDGRLVYHPHVERTPGSGDAGFELLAAQAAYVVADEFPAFFLRERNREMGHRLSKAGIPFVTVDSNGLIPLGLTDKDPYTAYVFRRIVQKNFVPAYLSAPKAQPLDDLKGPGVQGDGMGAQAAPNSSLLPSDLHQIAPHARKALSDIASTVASLPIRHDIPPTAMKGTREAALRRLHNFITSDLLDYNEKRNHPDLAKTSRLSPWLHFGQISEYEVVKAALSRMPAGWDLDRITFADGKSEGFFQGDPNVESFLNEVVTWRGVGYHYCHHRDDYAEFSSLPDWAKETMDEHRGDVRTHLYTFEQLEQAKTHDVIWNAAQNQLRREGLIHNYLRMLWGKKVIEWSPDPETALRWLIELNNQYALDGRDPNSYSGIFWCFGRFDRAWQEREIFGKLRYMSSDNTRRKVRLEAYLREYALG